MILSKAPLRLAVAVISLIVPSLVPSVLTIQLDRLLVIIECKIILENRKPLIELQKHEFRSYRVLFTIILHLSLHQSFFLPFSFPLLFPSSTLTSKFLN